MNLKKRNLGAGNRASLTMLAAGAFVALMLGLGLWRYDGPTGLWRRVTVELGALRPHPVFVPTPLPAVTRVATTTPATARQPSPMPSRPPTTARPLPSAAQPVTARPTGTWPMTTLAATIGAPNRTPTPSMAVPATQPTTAAPPPSSARLSGLTHYWQTWNNCGPATLAMYLSSFGLAIGQEKIGAALRPFADDKNVSPVELAAYAQAQGLRATVRVNGDAERLRQFVLAGLPVLVETWYEPKPNDGMGHYRLIVGFDDLTRTWIAYDSYDSHGVAKGQPYDGIRLPYDEFDRLWAVFNRTYLLVVDPARQAAAEQFLGADEDDPAMWQRSQASARAAVDLDPLDPFAWFNLGSSLIAMGDYALAADAFDRARQIGLPWRMLWYQFAPFRAYYEMGRYDEVLALADATLHSSRDTVEELFFWRGLALKATGDPDGARAAWQRAVILNPNYADAQAALATVGP